MLSRREFLKSTLGTGVALAAGFSQEATAQPARRRLIVDAQVHMRVGAKGSRLLLTVNQSSGAALRPSEPSPGAAHALLDALFRLAADEVEHGAIEDLRLLPVRRVPGLGYQH
jgi:hypothetical protein